MNIKWHMPKRAIRTTTALALAAVVAISLLMAGVDGASASPIIIIDQFTEQCSNGVAVQDPASNPGLVSDCAALLAAKLTLEGTSGNLDWSADVSIGDWEGVVIANNRVSELLLADYGLNGTIPATLGDLSSLDTLVFMENLLTGEMPSELGNLANLGTLNLHDNYLTGEIPPELGNLYKLKALHLDSNNLTGAIPSELGDASMLEFLLLDVNRLTGAIPQELGKLSNLTYLDLRYNVLTGTIPAELGRLVNLGHLDLSYNDLTGAIL